MQDRFLFFLFFCFANLTTNSSSWESDHTCFGPQTVRARKKKKRKKKKKKKEKKEKKKRDRDKAKQRKEKKKKKAHKKSVDSFP